MMPPQHAVISCGIGLLGWWWSGKPIALPASLVVGVFVDLDHIADYTWYAVTGQHRLLLPLHSYELMLPLGWIVSRRLGPRVAAVAIVSYLLHLFVDEWSNQMWPGTYSLVWRIRRGFRLEALSRNPTAGVQGRYDDLAMLRSIMLRLRAIAPLGCVLIWWRRKKERCGKIRHCLMSHGPEGLALSQESYDETYSCRKACRPVGAGGSVD